MKGYSHAGATKSVDPLELRQLKMPLDGMSLGAKSWSYPSGKRPWRRFIQLSSIAGRRGRLVGFVKPGLLKADQTFIDLGGYR